MKSFNFKDKLEVTIENKKYTIDLSKSEILQAILTITNKVLEINQDKLNDNLEQEINDTTNVCIDFIKICLGEDTFNELFENRIVDYTDWISLTTFIVGEIADFKEKKMKEFLK